MTTSDLVYPHHRLRPLPGMRQHAGDAVRWLVAAVLVAVAAAGVRVLSCEADDLELGWPD